MFNFNTQAPQYQGVDPRLIAMASQSPISKMGQAMTELDELMNARAMQKFSKDRALTAERQAEDRLGISQQQADIASANLGIAGMEEARKQNMFQQQQDAMGALQSNQELLGYLGDIKQAEKMGAEPVEQQYIDMLGTPMTIEEQIMTETIADPKGQSATLELMKLQRPNTMVGSRLYNTLLSNLKFEAENKGWTNERFNKEKLKLDNDFETKSLFGVSQGQENLDKSDMKKARDIGIELLDGKQSYSDDERYVANDNFITTTAYKTNAKLKEKEDLFYKNDRTIKSVGRLSNSLGEAIKSGAFDTGVIANLQQAYGQMVTSGFWRKLSGKTNEEIMKQAGLQGSIGIEVAERLRDVSGLAATDGEFRRTLNQVIGGDFTQEDVKFEILNNFKNKLVERNTDIGKSLTKRGLVGEVYDVWSQYNKTDTKTISSSNAKNAKTINSSNAKEFGITFNF